MMLSATTTTTTTASSTTTSTTLEERMTKFCQEQLQLLRYEYNYSDYDNDTAKTTTTTTTKQKQRQQQNVLHHLIINTISIGLYGRTIICLTMDHHHHHHHHPTNNHNENNNDDTMMVTTKRSTVATTTTTTNLKNNQLLLLPSHTFHTGDEIEMIIQASSLSLDNHDHTTKKRHPRGVICEITETSISIVLSSSLATNQNYNTNNKNNNNNTKNHHHDITTIPFYDTINQQQQHYYTIISRNHMEIYHKLCHTIQSLQNYCTTATTTTTTTNSNTTSQNEYHHHSLLHALFIASSSSSSPTITSEHRTIHNDSNDTIQQSQLQQSQQYNYSYFNSNLDDSQKHAIEFVLSNHALPIALIHGPPGTGKTTTLVELIQHIIYRPTIDNSDHHKQNTIHNNNNHSNNTDHNEDDNDTEDITTTSTIHNTTKTNRKNNTNTFQHNTILVTAPSNVAVDNILQRYVQQMKQQQNSHKVNHKHRQFRSSATNNNQQQHRIIRLGHPARIQQDIIQYSLESLVFHADGTQIVHDIRQELYHHMESLQKKNQSSSKKHNNNTSNKSKQEPYQRRHEIYREMKELRKEIRQREEIIVNELFQHANIIFTTCIGAAMISKMIQRSSSRANKNNNNNPSQSSIYPYFDYVIIDEAAQAIEASCWIPTLYAKTKLILAGDHLQLPPTIMCDIPHVQRGLSKTMFERLMELYGENDVHKSSNHTGRISCMLNVQYRMNETIANWASQALYHNELRTHHSVQHHVLEQLDNVQQKQASKNESNENDDDDADADIMNIESIPLFLIDTSGCNMYEACNDAGSRYNEGEVQLVVQHVQKLLSLGVTEDQIAIISPYNGQVELLRTTLLPEIAPSIQIRSVDGFQGGEREAVIISLVRSSDRGGIDGIGFLNDDRRLNVAVTRARRHCCIICDTETVSQSPFIQNLIEWIEEHGEQCSAMEMLSQFQLNEADMKQSELMVQQLIESAKQQARPISTVKKHSTQNDPIDTAIRRQALFDKIQTFCSSHEPGDELLFSDELTKLDRKIVHDIAEELKLEHSSDGVEGVSRRIKITIPNIATPILIHHTDDQNQACLPSISAEATMNISETDVVDHEVIENVPRNDGMVSPFAALTLDDDDDEHENIEENQDDETGSPHAMNSVLGTLARERLARDKEKPKQQLAKKKKSKGQKLGGGSAPLIPRSTVPTTTNSNLSDIDDDMAYLDAEIDAVQNSHGRQVVGSGKGYRTIVNGILLSQPMSRQQPMTSKNTKAVTALNSKLKAAQEKRKVQPKKK